jgi:hypothetical protein
MPGPDTGFGWQEGAGALSVIALVAFLVTWVVTDLLHVHRAVYVGILSATVLALSATYLAWSGTSMTGLIGSGWGWGLVAGIVAAGLAAPLVRRLPSAPHPAGARLGGLLLWEGLVYGSAEAVLLATLPVLAVWQAMSERGWTASTVAKVGSGTLAIAGALVVILVHHLGYVEFRASAARRKLVGALATCGVQALAFLLTGNILASLLAHIVLHSQMILRGVPLPPVSHAPGASRDPTSRSSTSRSRTGAVASSASVE